MSKGNGLDEAPEHVKLAVDLIMLLEQHELSPETVLQALPLVENDYRAKLAEQQGDDNNSPVAPASR